MLASGFILGLAGSLHCAGMCGPLVLMTPVVGTSRAAFVGSRLAYHAGRLATYAGIGLLFGALGESIAFAGFQRWISLVTGALMLVALLAAGAFKAQLWKMPMKLKGLFGGYLRRPSWGSVVALGAINGLLPCGLVYMAGGASLAAGGAVESVTYMLAFGAGTLPVMLSISLAGKSLKLSSRPWLQKVAPLTAAAVAILLIVRADPVGLFSGEAGRAKCPACVE